jgi:phosphatidylserine decarboxylase
VRGEGFDVTFKQIAGVLARRIVFRFRAGDVVERGQRVGLIKFSSRVNVLLPGNAHLRVALGDRVKGGASILADIELTTSEPLDELLVETLV